MCLGQAYTMTGVIEPFCNVSGCQMQAGHSKGGYEKTRKLSLESLYSTASGKKYQISPRTACGNLSLKPQDILPCMERVSYCCCLLAENWCCSDPKSSCRASKGEGTALLGWKAPCSCTGLELSVDPLIKACLGNGCKIDTSSHSPILEFYMMYQASP